MNRQDIEPGSVYLNHKGRYIATGDPVETEKVTLTRGLGSRTETRILFHPVDVSGDPYRFDPTLDYDEVPYRPATASTISEPLLFKGSEIVEWVCLVERWPARLAQMVADRQAALIAEEDELVARRADLVTAVAGLIGAGEDPAQWERWLLNFGAGTPRLRRFVAEALLRSAMPGPAGAWRADAEDYCDQRHTQLGCPLRPDLEDAPT